jgi:hypothetical protein
VVPFEYIFEPKHKNIIFCAFLILKNMKKIDVTNLLNLVEEKYEIDTNEWH